MSNPGKIFWEDIQGLMGRIAATKDPGTDIEFAEKGGDFYDAILDIHQYLGRPGEPVQTRPSTRIAGGPSVTAFRRWAKDPSTIPDRANVAGRHWTTGMGEADLLVDAGLIESTDPEDVLGFYRRVAVATGAASPGAGDSASSSETTAAGDGAGFELDPLTIGLGALAIGAAIWAARRGD